MSIISFILVMVTIIMVILAMGAPGVFLVLFLGLLAAAFMAGRKIRKWWREFDEGEVGPD